MPLQLSNVTSTSQSPLPAPSNNIGSKDVFLKLLVAQMKNQNPEKPQDPTQMSSQLAQFNMVEQQMSTNQFLKDMAAAQTSNATGGGGLTGASASYLGHSVTVNQSTLPFNGVTPIDFSTTLSLSAQKTQVVIKDSAGQVVRTMSLGAMAQGVQNIQWDGLSDSGTKVAAGNYSLAIHATDYQGLALQAAVQRVGVVNAVRMGQAGVELMVAGAPVDVASVTEVRL